MRSLLWPPLAALVLQALGLGFGWSAAEQAFSSPASLEPAAAQGRLLAGLGVAGVGAGALVLWGLARVHRRLRWPGATALTIVPYAPVVTVSVVATYVLLVLAGWW